MGIKQMQGTSAHLEYVGPRGRKRKTSCMYYKDKLCMCDKSGYYLLKCAGRSFCMNYEEAEDTKINCKSIDTEQRNNCNERIYKKIKVEETLTKKKYLIQLVSKDKENTKALIFDKNSNEGIMLENCKINDHIELIVNNEIRKFKVLEIKQG